MPVHNSDQIGKTLAHRKICNIRAPDLIGTIDFKPFKEIRIYLVCPVWLTGSPVLTRVYGLYTHQYHQSSYPLTVNHQVVVLVVQSSLKPA